MQFNLLKNIFHIKHAVGGRFNTHSNIWSVLRRTTKTHKPRKQT